MTSLIDKLRAKLDETERIATASAEVSPPPWTGTGKVVWGSDFLEVADDAGWTGMAEEDVAHMVHNDPDTVLRRVAADRKILARHQPVEQWGGGVGNVERWLVATHCAHCRGDGTEAGMYDNLSMPLPWPCAELADLAEGYGIEVPANVR